MSLRLEAHLGNMESARNLTPFNVYGVRYTINAFPGPKSLRGFTSSMSLQAEEKPFLLSALHLPMRSTAT